MYTALAESIISYGLSSYGRTFKSYLDQIYKLQVRLLKMIIPYNIKKTIKNDYDLFNFCKIIPIHMKVNQQILKEQFFRTDIQHPISHTKITRQISNNLLNIPRFTNYYGKRTSEYIVPKLINQIPKKVRNSITPNNIASVLKKEMLRVLDKQRK